MSKIFITGASGFIGRNLVRKLCPANTIYALVRRQGDEFDKGVVPVTGDILRPASFSSHISGCDILFHCAGHISFRKRDFRASYEVNVEGTKNILEAAYERGVKKVVYLSACAVLGCSKHKQGVLDETANPRIGKDNVYAYTKKLAEEEAQRYVRKGLDVSIANIATVYGRGDRNLNSGAIIRSIYRGRLKFMPPGGTSFVSVGDLIEGLILLAGKGSAGERYIFCRENMEYKVLAQRIAMALKVKEPRYTLPYFTYYPALWAVRGMELSPGFRNGRVNLITAQILEESYGYKYFSAKKAEEKLGWKPEESLEQAVTAAFGYYKENQLI